VSDDQIPLIIVYSSQDLAGGDNEVPSPTCPPPLWKVYGNLWTPAARVSPGRMTRIKLEGPTKEAVMAPATKPDQKRRLGFLTGLRLCEAIEREFPELSRCKVIRILSIVLDEMQGSVNERRYVMKRFDQLDARDQILLMTRLITIFADSGYLDRCHSSVAEWARAAGLDPFDIWRKVCADVGIDECAPWPGYPRGPKDFPAVRGDRYLLPDQVAKLLERIERPRTQ
jgi:hypothetical protein